MKSSPKAITIVFDRETEGPLENTNLHFMKKIGLFSGSLEEIMTGLTLPITKTKRFLIEEKDKN